MLADLVDSSGLRVLGYLVAAAAAFAAGLRERSEAVRLDQPRWPLFCFASAFLLAIMGVARGGGLADLVEDFGRSQAYVRGVYEGRFVYQIATLGIVSMLWLVGVGIAIWRVPERRARYLPAAVLLVSLIGFAAIRLVSFHYVDAVLYNRGIAGLRFVTIFELTGLVATVAAFYWHPFGNAPVFERTASRV